MADLTLTDDELVNLTRKHRPSAQCRVLRAIGIEHRRRPDGSVAVLRDHVEDVLGGKKPAARREVKRAEIDWT